MRFVARSLLQFILVIFAVTFVAFGAMNYLGDPLFNILGPIALEEAGPEYAEVRAEARAQFHLDDPFPVRYGRWIGDMLTGDFGRSYSNQVTVRSILAEKLPVTLVLMVYAQVIAVVISVPWALWTASRAYRLADKASTVLSFTMLGIPVFALAVLLFWLFAIRWQIFPTRYEDETIGQQLSSLFLPAMALAIPLIATYQRLLRTDLISTLQEDFISVARAKGLPKEGEPYWIAARLVALHAMDFQTGYDIKFSPQQSPSSIMSTSDVVPSRQDYALKNTARIMSRAIAVPCMAELTRGNDDPYPTHLNPQPTISQCALIKTFVEYGRL